MKHYAEIIYEEAASAIFDLKQARTTDNHKAALSWLLITLAVLAALWSLWTMREGIMNYN